MLPEWVTEPDHFGKSNSRGRRFWKMKSNEKEEKEREEKGREEKKREEKAFGTEFDCILIEVQVGGRVEHASSETSASFVFQVKKKKKIETSRAVAQFGQAYRKKKRLSHKIANSVRTG